MQGIQSLKWDRVLKELFDEVDDFLEDQYGNAYTLHPNRMKRGATSNKEMDGLINIGASFSPGFGSKDGRGYVVDLHLSTLERVPNDVKGEMEEIAINKVRNLLPKYFPNRDLRVQKDGPLYKILGDLSLGVL